MANHRHHNVIQLNAFQADPSRTLTLRNRFARDVSARFAGLKGVLRKSIIEQDCFGLLTQVQALAGAMSPAMRRQFAFTRTEDKITGFMEWLQEQEEKGILEISTRTGRRTVVLGERWTDVYVRHAYQKGIERARSELAKAGYDVPTYSQDEVRGAFNQPFHADRIGALYTRTFSELKGITAAMDQQISRVLAEGLAMGENPRQIARRLADRVDKIGITRARTLARTEIVRAHHIANVAEYRQAGVESVTVIAEWLTAGFNVCPICAGFHGRRFPLDKIEGMIPAHPRCRCCIVPIPRDERGR